MIKKAITQIKKTCNLALIKQAMICARIGLALICASSLITLPLPAKATGTNRLKQVEKEIKQRAKTQQQLEKKAKNLQLQRENLQKKIIILATKLQASEQRQNALTNEIEKLTLSEQDMVERLTRDRQKLAESLAALQKFAAQMPPAFAINPEDALSGIRGAIAIASIVPVLQATADKLRAQLEELTAIRNQMRARRLKLEKENKLTKQTRAQLAQLVKEKQHDEKNTQQAITKEKAAIQKLARQARSLRDLVRQLEKRRKPATRNSNFKSAKGVLPLPVSGCLLNRQKTARLNQEFGREGLYVKTKSNSLITAPFDANILYAGKFRDYGNILILGVGDGYHMLLSGVGQIHTEVNQQVLAGEPLGSMNENTANAFQENLTLYIEIRYKGSPISSYSWFASKT